MYGMGVIRPAESKWQNWRTEADFPGTSYFSSQNGASGSAPNRESGSVLVPKHFLLILFTSGRTIKT